MTRSPPPHPRRDQRVGFALVAAVMLMVLLVVLAVGLLTLSSVSMRGAREEEARSQAQANARLAVVLAFAQLQKLSGADQRITAPADILAPADHGSLANGGWRGVWRSNPRTSTSYQPGRSDFFEEWLVTSGEQPLAMDAARATIQGDSAIVSRITDMPDVRVPLLTTPNHGRLGWWTDDESLKARADFPPPEKPKDGEVAASSHAPPRLGPESVSGVAGFKPTAASAPKLITPGQLALAAGHWQDRQGRHFTTYSRSVLTDVRNGGLKRDLSTLFEQPAGKITEFGKWTGVGSESDPKVYLYGPPAVAMGARWNHLYHYYNLYKDVTFDGDEPRVQPKGGLIDWHDADNYVGFGDEAGGFRYPRMAKIIYLFSYTATKDSNTSNTKPYTLQLATDIFVTLWNPYDARIHFPVHTKFFAKLFQGLPMKFDWRVNGSLVVTLTPNDLIPGFSSPFNNPNGDREFSMSPGETVVFSMKKDGDTGAREFWPGAFFDGLTGTVAQITGSGSETISVGLKPDENANAATIDSQGNSQYMDFWIWDSVSKWPYYEHRGEILSRANAPFLSQMHVVSADQVPAVTLADVNGRKQPFGAFIMETKTARDSVVPIPAFLNTGTTRLSSKITGNLAEFANERLEYKVEPVSGFDSDIIQVSLPNSSNGANHGYIGSGRGPGSGQTHFLFSGIPTVPPTSLAQFRHAGVGDGAATLRATYWGFNSTPNAPYADQAVGNSYAHPLLPASSTTKNTLLDHRFLGNEVLWDRYFLSSLAPRSAARFGTAMTMAETWKEFLEGKSRLINARFSPWLGGETSDTVRHRLFPSNADSTMKTDAYKRIAAYLMLDGGFNVNSTSVEAWQAFLASTRNQPLTKLTKSGGTQGQKVTGSGTVFSRTETVLAGAVDDSSTSALDSHYSGYRDIPDDKLTKLAEAIVAQVRKRGPFLNMAEFLNRRPGGDQDLALSGPLQAAIDASGLNDTVAAAGMTGSSSPGGAGMAFPKASALNTAAGNTGWLMQGDVLDPLGPAIVIRGDTFRIRGYGESRTPQGQVTARAWCEVVVQRVPDYVDGDDQTEVAIPTQPLNVAFGRRYQLLSFRWLRGPHE